MELFIIRNGEQTGPFSTDTITALLNTGSLKPGDMAWRKGLPAWIPLNEALDPDSAKREEPPPINGVATPKKKATAKQKALLNYLGAKFEEDLKKDEAALVISDALENPKHAAKLAKWNEEKLRLHADIFQDEIDHRRANRVSRYLELCQTEGTEAVKDVTKAHVQVLIESLDKRNPTWEQEPRKALWDFLLPSVSEHFPQLVREDWKGKLKFGGAPKIAAAVSGTSTAGTLTPPAPPAGAIQAAMRGIIYGAVVLGVVIGGIVWYENHKKADSAPSQTAAAKPAEPVKKPEPAAPAPDRPIETPPVAANPPPEPPAPTPPAPADKPAVPDVAANTVPMKDPLPVPPADPSPAPANPPPATPATTFTPAPPPPPLKTDANPLPPASPTPAPAPGAVKDFATMTQAVAVQLQFGRVTIPIGTRVKLIAVEGPNARVNFNNNVILVPMIATDIDPNAPPMIAPANPPPPVAPTQATPPLAPAPAAPPIKPATPTKPSSDL